MSIGLEKGPLVGSLKARAEADDRTILALKIAYAATLAAIGGYAGYLAFQVFPPLIYSRRSVAEQLKDGARDGANYAAEQTSRGARYAAEQAHDGVSGAAHGFMELVSDYWPHITVFLFAFGVGGAGIFAASKHVQNRIHDKNNPIFKRNTYPRVPED